MGFIVFIGITLDVAFIVVLIVFIITVFITSFGVWVERRLIFMTDFITIGKLGSQSASTSVRNTARLVSGIYFRRTPSADKMAISDKGMSRNDSASGQQV